MRGIILTAGLGTRMLPATEIINKNLLPILHRPMILFSIDLLKRNFDITEILIISSPRDLGDFARFLKDGSEYKVKITYMVQNKPTGIASAIGLGENFIPKGEKFVVLLGDNIFLNNSVKKIKYVKDKKATIFTYAVKNPEHFGVVVFGKNKKPLIIEEKPKNPKSNCIVTGLYVYPYEAFGVIKKLKPSKRGEYEVTDLNNYFLKNKLCNSIPTTTFCNFWVDAGTPEALLEIGNFIINNRKK